MKTLTSPYSGDTSERIEYAVFIISTRRATNRAFDTCFEMGDADEVLKGIISEARTDAKLAANLPRYIAKSSLLKFGGAFLFA